MGDARDESPRAESTGRGRDDDALDAARRGSTQSGGAEQQREALIAQLEQKVRESEQLYRSLEARIVDREAELDAQAHDCREMEHELIESRERLRRWERDGERAKDEAAALRRDLDAEHTIELMKEVISEKNENIELLK
eukprot:gene24951-4154_t